MTDDSADEEVDTPETDDRAESLLDVDGALGLLVNLLNHAGSPSSMTMTFFIGAGVISGTMISFDEWMERWVGQMEAASGSLGSTFREALQQGDQESREPVDFDGSPKFLFMRDAELLQGPHVRPVQLWRGRVTQIDGWAMGAYATE